MTSGRYWSGTIVTGYMTGVRKNHALSTTAYIAITSGNEMDSVETSKAMPRANMARSGTTTTIQRSAGVKSPPVSATITARGTKANSKLTTPVPMAATVKIVRGT